jgi:hypothetical protein
MRFATNKQKLIIFIILILYVPLCAQTEIPDRKEFLKIKYDQTYLSISPLISPRICLGILNSAQRDDDRYQESIFYLHACETFYNYRIYGLAFRGNTFFLKNKRTGPFFIINVGIDYLQYEPFFLMDKEITFFPNIAIGTGYSLKLKNDSYFRLEWDIGYKWIISNLYLSYIW